jgi:3-hydroxyisobutyrate dehydrogenase-like beta-hydroxyacid dehydrogenase
MTGKGTAVIDTLRIALVGYGEVGGIFGAALAQAGVEEVRAFDILAADAAWLARARDRDEGVVVASTSEEAVAGADLVISAVTAAQTRAAAQEIARAVRKEAFVLDVNSASPRTKTECARIVDDAGGRYVEAAVMTSVPPHGIRVPMLLGGAHAAALQPMLAALGFDASVGSEKLGVVSAVKLCRSVVIKGMEALFIESMLAARHYGVEDEVLASLVETFPNLDWERQANWFWKRVVQHGKRRAEEMREAALTVTDAGVAPRMASATADVQAWIAELRASGVFDEVSGEAGFRKLVDRVPRKRGE